MLIHCVIIGKNVCKKYKAALLVELEKIAFVNCLEFLPPADAIVTFESNFKFIDNALPMKIYFLTTHNLRDMASVARSDTAPPGARSELPRTPAHVASTSFQTPQPSPASISMNHVHKRQLLVDTLLDTVNLFAVIMAILVVGFAFVILFLLEYEHKKEMADIFQLARARSEEVARMNAVAEAVRLNITRSAVSAVESVLASAAAYYLAAVASAVASATANVEVITALQVVANEDLAQLEPDPSLSIQEIASRALETFLFW